MRARPAHLVRRAVGSLSNRPVDAAGVSAASSVLLPGEMDLWSSMDPRDQRHSLEVLGRFDSLSPGAPREARAAALLHDVGKTESGLGWLMRIFATVTGPRTRRTALYADHERIGAWMIDGVSHPLTVALVGGTATGPHAEALRAADDL